MLKVMEAAVARSSALRIEGMTSASLRLLHQRCSGRNALKARNAYVWVKSPMRLRTEYSVKSKTVDTVQVPGGLLDA